MSNDTDSDTINDNLKEELDDAFAGIADAANDADCASWDGVEDALRRVLNVVKEIRLIAAREKKGGAVDEDGEPKEEE